MWLALTLILLGGTGRIAAAGGPLELEAILRFASEHSPALDSARRAGLVRGLERSNAFARFLPSADLSLTHGASGTSPSAGSGPFHSDLTLSLTENLYDNGQSWTSHRIAVLRDEAARIESERTRARLTLDISSEYHRYSLSTTLASAKKEQLALLRKQYSLVESQYRQGIKTKKDYLRLQARLSRSELDVLSAENDIKRASTELRRLIGAAPGDSADLLFSPRSPAAVSIPAGEPALEGTYESRQARVADALAAAASDLTRRKYWPQVSATAASAYSLADYESSKLSWSAQLGLTYNLWDWGTRRRDVEIAEHQERIANNDQRSNLQSTAAAIRTLSLNLARLRADYDLSRQLLAAEEESYAFLDTEYRQGRLSYLDLITSINDLLDAKTRLATTQFALLDGLNQYRYYEGTLHERLPLP